MENVINEAILSLHAIPVGIWVATMLYGLTMFCVYYFGLPFKNMDRRSYIEKEVSHGIVSTMQKARVYDAWYTEANVITMLGVIGLVGMIWMTISYTYTEVTPVLFILAAVYSDLLDGKACARWNCHSHIGAIIDPLRDRLAAIAIVIVLIISLGFSIFWVLPISIVVLFELGVGSIAAKAHAIGKTLNSHGAGEQRQVVHLLMIEVLLITVYLLNSTTHTLIITAFATSIMACASMLAFVNYKRLQKENL